MTYRLFKRPTKNGKLIWYYYYYDGVKRIRKSTGQSTKKDAIRWLQEHEPDRQPQKTITLRDWCGDFFIWDRCPYIARQHAAGRDFGRAIAKLRRGHLDNHILPKFGHKRLEQLNGYDIEGWLLQSSLSNATKNHICDTFNIVLNEAKRKRLIEQNPIPEVIRFKPQAEKRDVFTLEEIKSLFPKDEERLLELWRHPKWATMYFLMLTTGMRVGEIGALLWKHVVWDLPGVLILQAIKADGSIGPPKSSDVRGVLIPDRTVKMLQWWRAQSPYPEDDCLIFFGEDGYKNLNSKTIARKIYPVLERAGIDKARKLSAHSCRYYYNTVMRNVLNEAALHYMIGHKSRAMTERYTNIEPEDRLKQLRPAQHVINQVWD